MKPIHYLIILSTLFFVKTVEAQQYLQDITGKPMQLKAAEDDVEGSSYLSDDWLKATVILSNGKTYKGVLVKYDLREDQIYFKGQTGESLEFVIPVKEFVIVTDNKLIHYRNGYNIAGLSTDAFFEVLSDGTTQLLKRTVKYVETVKEYNSPSIKKMILSVKYYMTKNNITSQIKPDKKSILNALSDKQKQLEEYIKTNSINFKSDADLAKLITYYNSI